MICRLCLNETEFYLRLKNEKNQEKEEAGGDIAEIIGKYFELPLDVISDVICSVCWQKINEFHKFYLFVEEKQKELSRQSKCLVSPKTEGYDALERSDDDEDESHIRDNDENEVDMSDMPLLDSNVPMPQEETEETKFGEQTDPLNIVASKNATQSSGNSPDVARTADALEIENQHSTAGIKEEQGRISNARIKREKLNLIISQHSGVLKCDMCAQPLENFDKLVQHFKDEHNRRGYVACCNNRYSKRQDYAEHLEWHLNPNLFKCESCNSVYASRKSYDSHISRYHPAAESLKFQCPHCPQKFSIQSLLNAHTRTRHNTMQGEYKCEECNKNFKTLESCKAHHKMIHLRASVTMCDICGKNFSSKSNCEIHKSTVHQSAELTKVECPTCHRWFKNSSVLYRHSYEHREDLPKEYTCDVCGAVKSTRNLLNTHKRYHHEDAAFKCSICGKKCKSKTKLKEHVSSHTGVPNYSCEFCARPFNAYGNMVKHKKQIHKDKYDLNRNKDKYKPSEK